jgi:hypothetical protein
MPRAIRNPSNAIIEALSKRGKATWAELLEDTKLSKGALSSYITEMLNRNKIAVETDTSKRPPKTLYVLVDPAREIRKKLEQKKHPFFFNTDNLQEPDYSNPDYVALSIYVGHLISTLKDREKARRLLKDYLEFVSNYLLSDIVAGISVAHMLSDYKEGEPSSSNKETFEAKKGTEEILNIWKNNHTRLDEGQIIQAIFWTAFKNKDIALEGKDAVFYSFAKEISIKMDRSFMQKFINDIIKIEKDKEGGASS